jgi:molybdate-binding protein
MKVVEREQGIIVAAGNPKSVQGVADLARSDMRIINREPAAGTRLILDALLQHAGIDPVSVRGYDNEEFTHTAVAAMVASGAVDAGFGIRAAAARLNLGFVPLVRERYLFALRRADLRTRPIVEMRGVLRGQEFAAGIRPLAGYAAVDSGSILTVEEMYP